MPEQVWITRTGAAYHARKDCECAQDARGWISVELDEAGRAMGLKACDCCGPPRPSGMTEADHRWVKAIADWTQKGLFETRWERAFAYSVLARVPNLSPDDVEPQKYVTTGDGESGKKVDFFIERARLALEVDGYRKDGEPPSQVEIEKRNRFDNALQATGARVSHFSNSQVMHEPEDSISRVSDLMTSRQDAKQPDASAEGQTTAISAPPSTPAVTPTAQQQSKSRTPVVVGTVAILLALIVGAVVLFGGGGSSDTASEASDVTQENVEAELSVSEEVERKEDVGGGDVAIKGDSWVEPVSAFDCPDDFPLKGNIKGSGEPDGKDYLHSPSGSFYDKTSPTRCYSTRQDAYADGFVEYFESCGEVPAYVETPFRQDADDPRWFEANDHLDGDQDGVACE